MQTERTVSTIETPPMPVFDAYLNIPFADLRDFKNNEQNQCRYIPAKQPSPEYFACGIETLPGESYCGHCTEMLKPKAQLSSEERAALTATRIHNYHRANKVA